MRFGQGQILKSLNSNSKYVVKTVIPIIPLLEAPKELPRFAYSLVSYYSELVEIMIYHDRAHYFYTECDVNDFEGE